MIALVVADFATYSALRSSLYKQDDQSLAQTSPVAPGPVRRRGHVPDRQHACLWRRSADGGWRRGPRRGGSRGAERVREHPFIEVRTTSGHVVDGAAVPGLRRRYHRTPHNSRAHITGFSTQPDGTHGRLFHRGVDQERRPGVPGAGDRRPPADPSPPVPAEATSVVVAEPIGDHDEHPAHASCSLSWR